MGSNYEYKIYIIINVFLGKIPHVLDYKVNSTESFIKTPYLDLTQIIIILKAVKGQQNLS